ncbi:MAG: hypothetical protein FWD68_04925 [Alphaproteobacteria bacterium]|nr:hypothetical protein [Alphaproteobacteria bacterium]
MIREGADLAEANLGHFRTMDRKTGYLLPPSINEWSREKDLARFVVKIVDGMDLEFINRRYWGSGSAAFPPAMMVALLIYGCATGTFRAANWKRRHTTTCPFASLQ